MSTALWFLFGMASMLAFLGACGYLAACAGAGQFINFWDWLLLRPTKFQRDTDGVNAHTPALPADAEKLCWAIRQFVKLVPAGDGCRLQLNVGPQSFFVGIESMPEDEAAHFAGLFVIALAGMLRQVANGVGERDAP